MSDQEQNAPNFQTPARCAAANRHIARLVAKLNSFEEEAEVLISTLYFDSIDDSKKLCEVLPRLWNADNLAVALNGEDLGSASERNSDIQIKPGDVLFITNQPQAETAIYLMFQAMATATAETIITELALTGFSAILVETAVTLIFAAIAVALVPPPQDDASTFNVDVRPDITGAGNRANTYGPIPKIYGTYKYAPPLAANYYTELVGSDQFLRMLLCIGYGPLKFGDIVVDRGVKITQDDVLPTNTITIGETDIGNFEGVQYEIGFWENITLYTDDIQEENVQVSFPLVTEVGEGGWFVDGDSAVRTTATRTSEISIDITFPSGLYTMGADGKLNYDVWVDFKVEYRKVGDTVWTQVPDANPWRIAGPKKETHRVGLHWPVPEDGQYEVQVTRVQSYVADREVTVMDAYWTTLRSIRYAYKDKTILNLPLPTNADDTTEECIPETAVQTATSAVDAEELSVIIKFPDGLYYMGYVPGTGGAVIPTVTYFKIEYRLVGATDWEVAVDSWEVRGRESDAPFYATYTWVVPKGQYEVRVSRLQTCTWNIWEAWAADAEWYSLNVGGEHQPWRSKEDIVLMAVRIKATDQLSGVVDNLKVLTTAVKQELKWADLPDSSYDITTLHAWNSTDGANSYAIPTEDGFGFWRCYKINPDTGNSNTEFLSDKFWFIPAGLTKVKESILIRSDNIEAVIDPARGDFKITFFTNNGHHGITPTFTDLGAGIYLAEAEYTLDPTDDRIRYPDFTVNVANNDYTYIDFKRPKIHPLDETLKAYEYVELSNPSKCYIDALIGKQAPYPIDVNAFDYTALTQFADWCDGMGLSFNWVFLNHDTMFKRIQDITTTGLASWLIVDTKFSVVRDVSVKEPVQVITPRNSWNFTSEKVFLKPPHAIRVMFTDPYSWEVSGVYAYAPGYDDTNATVFEEIQSVGITDPDQAWKLGMYFYRAAILRPERFSVDMDFEYMVCIRGDYVKLAYDVVKLGIRYGRIASVTVDGSGNATALVTDETLPFDSGVKYALGIRRKDGTYIVVGITSSDGGSGLYNNINLDSATPGVNAGDLFIFGEQGKETLDVKVRSIAPAGGMTATLTLVPAAFDIWDFDDTPTYDPGITNPPDVTKLPPTTPTIDWVDSGTDALYRDLDGNLKVSIMIGYSQSGGNKIPTELVEVRWRPIDTGEWLYQQEPWGSSIRLTEVEQGVTYELQIRSWSVYRQVSEWSSVWIETVEGKLEPPSDVQGFSIQASEQGDVVFTWEHIPDPDKDSYEIRTVDDLDEWGSGNTASLVVITAANTYTYTETISGLTTFYIKAIDTSGIYSQNAAAASINIVPAVMGNITPNVIDNNVLLQWSATPGTFPIKHYEVVRGSDPDNPDKDFGTTDTTFVVIFEMYAGDYTYNIRAVDTNGGKSDWSYVTVAVNEPPDFIARGSFNSYGSGVKTNATLEPSGLLAPVNTAETWDQHFSNNGWNTTDDQVAAGYSYIFEPTETSGTYEEIFDVGALVEETSNIKIILSTEQLDGIQSITPLLETATSLAGPWTSHGNVYQALVANFRYIKFTLTFDGGTNKDNLHLIKSLNVTVSAKRKTDQSPDVEVYTKTYAIKGDGSTGYFRAPTTTATGAFAFLVDFQCLNAKTVAGQIYNSTTNNVVLTVMQNPTASDLWVNLHDDAGTLYTISRTGIVADGDRVRVLVYYDGSDKLYLYSNGVLLKEKSIGAITPRTGTHIFAGVDASLSTAYAVPVNEIQYFSGTFTAEELTAISAAEYASADSRCVNAYQYTEGTGTSVADDSGNGNTGTLIGTVSWIDDFGKAIQFNVDFADVNSITADLIYTPGQSQAVWKVIDFRDIPNPEMFRLIAYDASGNQVSTKFTWTARGF